MSLLIRPSVDQYTEPKHSKTSPRQLVETVRFDRGQDEARSSRVRTRIFEATPSIGYSLKGESFQFCYIVSGVVELAEEGGESRRFFGPATAF